MALEITPGKLDAEDGQRIRPEPVIPDFVRGTKITNFGLDELGAGIGIVISSTEAPSSPRRNTLWFRRGNGRLYKFDIVPNASVTEGRWVSLSERRDALVLYNTTIASGEVLVRDTTETNMSVIGRFNRHLMKVVGNRRGDEVIDAGDHIPPYFVAQTEGTTGDVHVVTEVGYVDTIACGATGPAHGVLSLGMADTRHLLVVDDPYPTPSTRSLVGHIVQSEATLGTQKLTTFFSTLGTNLVI